MCRKLILMLCLSGVALPFPRVCGQNPPALKAVKISVSVTLTSDLFVYDYSVSNDVRSTAPVWSLGLDVSVPQGATALSPVGLSNGEGFLSSSANTVLTLPGSKISVPIGAQAPVGWAFSPSASGTLEWAAVVDTSLLLPGQSIQGFELTSPGLPGIRAFTATPNVDLESLNLTPPKDPGDLNRYENDLANAESHLSVQGQTISPTAPPANFEPLAFLQTVRMYNEQALKLGWIDKQRIANRFDAKIIAAQVALQAGHTKRATRALKELVNEVECTARKHLNSEAVALLKFNTLFLIDKIQILGRGDHDEEDSDIDEGCRDEMEDRQGPSFRFLWSKSTQNF